MEFEQFLSAVWDRLDCWCLGLLYSIIPLCAQSQKIYVVYWSLPEQFWPKKADFQQLKFAAQMQSCLLEPSFLSDLPQFPRFWWSYFPWKGREMHGIQNQVPKEVLLAWNALPIILVYLQKHIPSKTKNQVHIDHNNENFLYSLTKKRQRSLFKILMKTSWDPKQFFGSYLFYRYNARCPPFESKLRKSVIDW